MMTVNRAIAGLLVLSSSSTTFLASAWSTGAGTCVVDTAGAPPGPAFPDRSPHYNDTAGDLCGATCRYQVDIDGTVLSSGTTNAVNLTSASQVTAEVTMMTVNRAIAGLLVLFSSSTTFLASAWPTGTGTRVVGAAGPAFPAGSQHDGDGAGELCPVGANTTCRYQVDIDGTVLSSGTTNAVNLTSASQVTLTKLAGASLGGFLITLSATGQDLAGALSASTGDSQALTSSGAGANSSPDSAAVCPEGVAGGTHTNNTDKSAVSMGLSNLPDGAVEMTVTIVRRRNQFYFSVFPLTVTNEASGADVTTDVPTMMPTMNGTMAPTAMNGTDMPTMMPAMVNGTDMPTTMPTSMPTMAPTMTMAPTVTAAPTMNGTYEPTMMPTANDTDVPTMMPTANDTDAPTMMPVPNTTAPTMMPTEMPTETPTEMPTETPTATPTEMPTEEPTDEPTPETSGSPTITFDAGTRSAARSSRALSKVASSVLAAAAATVSYLW
eukprot:CAMPEP_0197465598 /NCGR_PEP_ID=MMETSP1175-20131217/64616_1 /TAXON_ID=1003142 /ORGANISM="Triceratium dubium, Strain CCMP147" /LENGTH=492 /DNA_ID=CAMNT_0043001617 /DNA_START=113 /DNA_END=1588 /DNA_ORIENTATION=+